MASCTSSQSLEWVDDIQRWLDAGVSEVEIGRRLQARVPEFRLSPDPGGQWNWLLGLLALGVASGTLFLIARGTVRRGRPARIEPETKSAGLSEEEEELQDRLDDELLDFG